MQYIFNKTTNSLNSGVTQPLGAAVKRPFVGFSPPPPPPGPRVPFLHKLQAFLLEVSIVSNSSPQKCTICVL